MPELWPDLLDCIDLRRLESSVFEGRNQRLPYHRLFGGQLLAQFVRAAGLTCPGKTAKSVHVLFGRPGGTDAPVRYEVACQHEGASFATLTIVARQLGAGQAERILATAAVSMHATEDGPDHRTAVDLPAVLGTEHRVELDLLPWETRSAADLDSPAVAPPEFDMWMRTPPVSPDLASALIAYGTDLTLIGTALRPLGGLSQQDAGTAFTSAVTSHTLWFHGPFGTDDWLLLRQHSPVLAHGRCFGRGDVLTRNGTLVASYAQEALLRFKA